MVHVAWRIVPGPDDVACSALMPRIVVVPLEGMRSSGVWRNPLYVTEPCVPCVAVSRSNPGSCFVGCAVSPCCESKLLCCSISPCCESKLLRCSISPCCESRFLRCSISPCCESRISPNWVRIRRTAVSVMYVSRLWVHDPLMCQYAYRVYVSCHFRVTMCHRRRCIPCLLLFISHILRILRALAPVSLRPK